MELGANQKQNTKGYWFCKMSDIRVGTGIYTTLPVERLLVNRLRGIHT